MKRQYPCDAGKMITAALERSTKEHSEEIAVISDDQIFSYGQLYEFVEKLISDLSVVLNKRKIIVGLRFEDPVKHLIASLALLKMKITQVSIDARTPTVIQMEVIDKTGVMFVIQDLADRPPYPDSVIVGQDYRLKKIHKTRIAHHFAEKKAGKILLESTAFLFMGSGTTGKAKILAVEFDTLSHLIDRDLKIRDFLAGERHYSYSRIDYYTTKRRILGALYRGVTIVLPLKQPKNIVAFCRKYKIDHLSLTTSQAIALIGKEKVYQDTEIPMLPLLKSLFVGSSPVSEELRKKLKKQISENLFVVYGTNEFGEATIAALEDQIRCPETVGRACPGVSIKIVNKDGKECAMGTVGRICLRSDQMMRAYVDDPEATRKAFSKEGYYPGDLGYMTPDGCLVFSGREDDMMIYSGVNIYPREIEQILDSHPQVIESAAFPLPINGHEGIPFAAVRVRMAIPEKELLCFCQEKLQWRAPKRIFFLQEFPRNRAGKVLKKILAEMAKAKLMELQRYTV